jgi:hypothetical protein
MCDVCTLPFEFMASIMMQNGCLVGSLLDRPGIGFAVRLKK